MNTAYVMVVEDSEDDWTMIERALQHEANLRNEIVRARDGVEALELLFERDALPAVVLLDLKLPRLNGLEVLIRIRAERRTELLPVVVLTNSIEQEDVQAAWRANTNSYIRKPMTPEDFMQVVRDLGLYWILINESPFEL
jgi:two-component system response regulator